LLNNTTPIKKCPAHTKSNGKKEYEFSKQKKIGMEVMVFSVLKIHTLSTTIRL
jgi:hypothetical protein